jgi:hypothetical protein
MARDLGLGVQTRDHGREPLAVSGREFDEVVGIAPVETVDCLLDDLDVLPRHRLPL